MGRKMLIIAGYYEGETYGLLGPQMAATVISAHTPVDCRVVAVTRQDDADRLRTAVLEHFGAQRPLVGFSLIGGREDLVALAATLRAEGATTLLAGPQAGVDFAGEVGRQEAHPQRFKGYSHAFSFALQGPVEQVIPWLIHPGRDGLTSVAGIVHRKQDGDFTRNPPDAWDPAYLNRVDWANLYRFAQGAFVPLTVTSAQVLQQIGCPYAAKGRWVAVDYPACLDPEGGKSVRLNVKGCSFCDVAVDKGFFGALTAEAVLDQIAGLPDGTDGRKVPFELINENPLPGLNRLLNQIVERRLEISSIRLTLRADALIRGEAHLRKALQKARDRGFAIVLGSMGFEAFDDRILKNLNKGVDVRTNLAAVHLIRRLKEAFPDPWRYSRAEGGNHGFIHPTPWDTARTAARTQQVLAMHRLPMDILPAHSTPLIIHHAANLADWIRAIEKTEGVRFDRNGPIIAWWQVDGRFTL